MGINEIRKHNPTLTIEDTDLGEDYQAQGLVPIEEQSANKSATQDLCGLTYVEDRGDFAVYKNLSGIVVCIMVGPVRNGRPAGAVTSRVGPGDEVSLRMKRNRNDTDYDTTNCCR